MEKRIRRHFADIRGTHGTLMTEHLRDSEIDFLHGRVASSIFVRNYFNPSLISDLKERTQKATEYIEQKIMN